MYKSNVDCKTPQCTAAVYGDAANDALKQVQNTHNALQLCTSSVVRSSTLYHLSLYDFLSVATRWRHFRSSLNPNPPSGWRHRRLHGNSGRRKRERERSVSGTPRASQHSRPGARAVRTHGHALSRALTRSSRAWFPPVSRGGMNNSSSNSNHYYDE